MVVNKTFGLLWT